jgi:hypothetical protein
MINNIHVGHVGINVLSEICTVSGIYMDSRWYADSCLFLLPVIPKLKYIKQSF